MVTSLHSARYKRLCSLLVERRQAAGLTQEAVAKRLSRPQSFVAKYEIGERRLDIVELLDVAEAIGFDAKALLTVLQRS